MLTRSSGSTVIDNAGAWARFRQQTTAAPVRRVSRSGRSARLAPCVTRCERLLRVAIADDCRDTADSLAVLMQLWGHDVRVTYSGAKVLEIASDYRPDVFLLDIAMPQPNGLMLARQLRGQPLFVDALLVAITGYADAAHRRLGMAAGFDIYLAKPVEPTALERLLMLEKNHRVDKAFRRGTPIAANFAPMTRSAVESIQETHALALPGAAQNREPLKR
jgi:CheY-like chemotaxis protein